LHVKYVLYRIVSCGLEAGIRCVTHAQWADVSNARRRCHTTTARSWNNSSSIHAQIYLSDQ